MARQPVGRTISVLCIDPHAAAAANGGDGPAASKQMECRLTYYRPWDFNDNNHHGGHQVWDHYQQSKFRVACTDLSDGMPNPDGCFQFVLTNSVIGAYDRDGIEVRVGIYKYTGRCV
jgi:E3 ubiquitin-protein ligase SIAH1